MNSKPLAEKLREYAAELVWLTAIVGFAAVVIKVNVDSDLRSQRALYLQGYTKIEILGYAHFGCGNDIVRDKFVAVNPAGVTVTGTVCSGLFSDAAVVRTE